LVFGLGCYRGFCHGGDHWAMRGARGFLGIVRASFLGSDVSRCGASDFVLSVLSGTERFSKRPGQFAPAWPAIALALPLGMYICVYWWTEMHLSQASRVGGQFQQLFLAGAHGENVPESATCGRGFLGRQKWGAYLRHARRFEAFAA
jgi:hypothetical protein